MIPDLHTYLHTYLLNHTDPHTDRRTTAEGHPATKNAEAWELVVGRRRYYRMLILTLMVIRGLMVEMRMSLMKRLRQGGGGLEGGARHDARRDLLVRFNAHLNMTTNKPTEYQVPN